MKSTTLCALRLPGLMTLMHGCLLALISPQQAAAQPLGAQPPPRGNLLLKAKGEVEVFHNGRKIVLRDKADGQGYLVKIPERDFRPGDALVLHVRSPHVYRVISVAINLDGGKAGQVPVKKSHWRFLGDVPEAGKVTAADILACKTPMVSGIPDAPGEAQREKLSPSSFQVDYYKPSRYAQFLLPESSRSPSYRSYTLKTSLLQDNKPGDRNDHPYAHQWFIRTIAGEPQENPEAPGFRNSPFIKP